MRGTSATRRRAASSPATCGPWSPSTTRRARRWLRGAVRRVAAAERALTDDGDLRSAAAKRLDRDAALLALFALVPADREAAP